MSGEKIDNYRLMVMLDMICKGSADLFGRKTSQKIKMKIYVSPWYRTSDPWLSSRTPSPFGYRGS